MSFIRNNFFIRRARVAEGLFQASPLFSGLLGITLLMPAMYFVLTLVLRVCFGERALYDSIAPSFLQPLAAAFSLHKAQVILGAVLLALLVNLLTVVRFHLQRGRKGWEVQLTYRRYWLNTAIALQSVLLLLGLLGYTFIQHIRY